MQLCRFNGDRLGLVDRGLVHDITYTVSSWPAEPWPGSPGDPIVRHLHDLSRVHVGDGDGRPVAEVTLNSLITAPTKVMAAPANYRKHAELDTADPGVDQGVHRDQLAGLDSPVESLGLFLKASSSLAGPGDGIRIGRSDRRTDYEVELAVVIGRTAREVPASEALSAVAGYCVGLDISVRGSEDRSFRKSADSFTVLGPWLTTVDEIADPGDLELWLRLNGEERQRASTAEMTVAIPLLVELASAAYTLHPGDVLLTGTPEGVGPIAVGDTIEAGGAGLGEMTVRVGR